CPPRACGRIWWRNTEASMCNFQLLIGNCQFAMFELHELTIDNCKLAIANFPARPTISRGLAVWTPKRILILLAGLALFLCIYGIYAFFLSSIDGLPQLPEHLAQPDISPPHKGPEIENRIEKKLRLAFGDACPELKRAIRLDLVGKGWGLAADQFEPESD